MSWNADVYLRFADERTRPAIDLLARVAVEAPGGVVDLGCGPGNSTALLAARWPDADLLGLDSSAEMIAAAHAANIAARFAVADFESWTPDDPPDVIFANAAFQWSRDPVALVRRLFAALPPDGVLAFQTPQNFDQPSHLALREVAGRAPWTEKLTDARWYDPAGFPRADTYARALDPVGAALDVWTTDYLHILTGEDPVYRWIEGTGLRPFLARLEGAERAAFIVAMKAALASAYPREPDGTTFFPFRRLFVIAGRR